MGIFSWIRSKFSDLPDEPEINPANGLPMVGGVDVEGNPYGSDLSSLGSHINPASGLPMIGGGASGIDVAGNPYDTDLSDTLNVDSPFDDSFSSSLNDPFNDSFGSSSLFDD